MRGRELQHNVACACGMRVGFSMFDVPDPLVVHVLLLTHEFMCRVGQNHIYTVYVYGSGQPYLCIMSFASLILGILSVTDVQQHEVHVPKTHR